MAKRYKGYSAKTSKSAVIITTLSVMFALLAIAYAVLSACLHSFNPVEWFKKGDTAIADTTDNVILDVEDNENVYDMAGQIMFMSDTPIEDMTVTIRATVLPEDADNKQVTWESDCDDVAVVPSEEGSCIATVYVIGNWPECQAVITCRSISNPEVFASCNVIKLAGPSAFNLNASLKDEPESVMFSKSYTVNYEIEDNVEPGAGVKGEFGNLSISVKLGASTRALVDEGLEGMRVVWAKDKTGNSNTFELTSPYNDFGDGATVYEPYFNIVFLAALTHERNLDTNTCEIVVTLDYTYDGVVVGNIKRSVYTDFDISNINIALGAEYLGEPNALALDDFYPVVATGYSLDTLEDIANIENCTATVTNCTINLTDNFKNEFRRIALEDYGFDGESLSYSGKRYEGDTLELDRSPYKMFKEYNTTLTESTFNKIFKQAWLNLDTQGDGYGYEVEAYIKLELNGYLIRYETVTTAFKMDVSTIWIDVEDIELDKSEIIFPTT